MTAAEREWEKMWTGESQDDGCQVAHTHHCEDEDYCEGCDSPVTYAGPDDRYGTCNCEENS